MFEQEQVSTTAPATVAAYQKNLQAIVDENPEATILVKEVIETFEAIKANKGKGRGQLAGIPLEEMTDEQLKREVINANSVLYKAKKRGAKQEVIDANQARLDAAVAERDARKAAKGEAVTTTEGDTDVYAEGESVPADEVDASEL